MKIMQICCLSLAFVCLIIGIHQSIIYGITQSYWLFMFSLAFLFAYKLFGPKEDKNQDQISRKNVSKVLSKTQKTKK